MASASKSGSIPSAKSGSLPSAPPAPRVAELRDETWRAQNRPDNLFGSSVVEEDLVAFALVGGSGASGPAPQLSIALRRVTMNHALMQIVREIVMNCTDLVERDPTFRKISVAIDPAEGAITVRNDGRGIPVGKDLIAIEDPVRKASLEGLWSPTLMLARWGCSSNYDDDESTARFTAGKNGLGAKAVMAWCSRVELRAVDSVRCRSFAQTWTDGMRTEQPPKVKENLPATKRGFTELKLWPDYAKLVKLPLPLSPDQVAVLRWCAWECSTVLPAGARPAFGISIDGCTLPDHTAEGMMRAVQQFAAACSGPAALFATAAPLKVTRSTPATPAASSTPRSVTPSLSAMDEEQEGCEAGDGGDAGSVAGSESVAPSPSAASPSVNTLAPIVKAEVTWAPHGEVLSGYAFPTHALPWGGIASALPQLGFVNGVPCPKGTHRRLWESALATDLGKKLGAKISLPRGALLSNMVLCVCGRINKPRFSSQTKEELATVLPRAASLAGKVPVAPLARSGFFTALKAAHASRVEESEMRTVASQLLAMPSSAPVTSRRRYDVDDVEGYEGAELAGRVRPCFLFLTEGKSAQNCARGVIARMDKATKRRCGSLALRGKIINAATGAKAKVLANKEVQALIRVCNLNPALGYEKQSERDTLRYAKLVLWTDADTDGGHIAWLVFLLVYTLWPRLAVSGYVERFVTPLLKVVEPARSSKRAAGAGAGSAAAAPGSTTTTTSTPTSTSTSTSSTLQFYSEAARDRWLESKADELSAEARAELGEELSTPAMWQRALDKAVSSRGSKMKYFKGLGRLMAEDEKDLAARFEDLRIRLEVDGPADEALIANLGAEDAGCRRQVQGSRSIRALPYDDVDRVTIGDFVDGELLPYMRDANLRQIPAVDGFIEVTRMIMAYFFVKPAAGDRNAEHGVARLAAAIAAELDYHHGEVSMAGAIASMAQDFAGKNNMNLLSPRGQFGTRAEPTPAAPRYTNTALAPYVYALFPPADYPALPMPRHGEVPTCIPGVIPLLLVNGATGIGYGHSTEVPPHHPRAVLAACRAWIDRHRGSDLLAHPARISLARADTVEIAMDPEFEVHCTASLTPWVRGLDDAAQPIPIEAVAGELDAGDGTPAAAASSSSSSSPSPSPSTPSSSPSPLMRVFESRGKAELTSSALVISELPVGVWTSSYRAALSKLPWLAGVYMHPRNTSVRITAELTGPVPAAVSSPDSMLRALKLVKRVGYTNMKLFDRLGALRGFRTPAEIVHDFALLRLWIYARRKQIELGRITREVTLVSNRLKFVELQVVDEEEGGVGGARSGSSPTTLPQLEMRTFKTKALAHAALEGFGVQRIDGSYAYLDSIPVWQLTREEVLRLREKHRALEQERAKLLATSLCDMWANDLDAAERAIEKGWREKAEQDDLDPGSSSTTPLMNAYSAANLHATESKRPRAGKTKAAPAAAKRAATATTKQARK